MANLIEDMKKIISSQKLGKENIYSPFYKTGIDILDYRNGQMTDDDGLSLGIKSGILMSIIGKSGTGKSTMAIQIATHIVDQFENSNLFYLDFERGMDITRLKSLTGWSTEKYLDKAILLNSEINSESVLYIAKAISLTKNDPKNYEEIAINTGKLDRDGNEIRVLPPTVMIVDSVPVMVPKDILDEKEMSGSMSAAQIAKTNNTIFKRIISVLEEANILLILINHITDNIDIGIVKKAASINYLKQSESIPGGTSSLYLSSNILKLTHHSKLEEEKDYGIKGFIVNGDLIKSRSNEAGRVFQMVYSQSEGYDNILTNLRELKNQDMIGGNGRAYYLKTLPDIKFTQKNFKEKYLTIPELKEAVDLQVAELYEKFISNRDLLNYEEPELELIECIDEESDVWLANDGKYYIKETMEEVEVNIEEVEVNIKEVDE